MSRVKFSFTLTRDRRRETVYCSMASQSDRSPSQEEIEELEDLIRQSEAAIESVTELIQDLAGDDWEQLSQVSTDPSCQQNRESGIFELTEPADKEELVELKRELRNEEIEAEFHDLLNSLILELNHVNTDFTENIPVWPPAPHQDLELIAEDKKTTTTPEFLTCDAATQTEIKKKSLKCTIL